jgi:hypothetical protein
MAAGHLLTVAMGFYKIKLLYHGAVAVLHVLHFFSTAHSHSRPNDRPATLYYYLFLSLALGRECVCFYDLQHHYACP